MSSTMFYPESVPTLGATKLQAVVAIVDPTKPLLSTEINAATSVELSCAVFPEGWNPTVNTTKGEGKRRLCSKRGVQRFNPSTYELPNLQYVHNPQGDDTDANNKARALLKAGTTIYIVERQGPDAETVDWAVGDRVLVHKLILGEQVESGDRTDDNGEFYIDQAVIYAGAGAPVVGTLVA